MAETTGQTVKVAPPFYKRIGTFLGEVRTEMGKVVWPTRAQVQTYTRVVIGTTAVVSITMGLFDSLLSHGLRKFFEMISG